MARSLRDELLKAGLVTGEQAARAERGRRAFSKSTAGKTARKAHRGGERRLVRPASGGEPQEAPVRCPPVVAEPAIPDPEERVRQLNLAIRRILDTEAEKAANDTDTPFHFPRGDRLKRLYVSEAQRRRLASGELAIIGFRGRHHLVPRSAGERVRELRPEVFVFIASGKDAAPEIEDGYEGYEIPDGLVW
ncbi:MAG: DUF2058 family protein [Thiotrichales bacterium]|nr:DUF2058 family protein [Thiotrichales bacterium]